MTESIADLQSDRSTFIRARMVTHGVATRLTAKTSAVRALTTVDPNQLCRVASRGEGAADATIYMVHRDDREPTGP